MREATAEEIELALQNAAAAAPQWAATPPAERARLLEAAADRLKTPCRAS